MIVVTGAKGFIGSNLVKKLSETEEQIIAVDLKDVKTNYIDGLDNVIFIEYEKFYDNLENFVTRYGKPEIIFREGAISSTTETDWDKLLKYNVECTKKLIYFCESKIDLQYASSASVYGNPSKEEWIKKVKICNPLNLYARSKFDIDVFVSKLMFTNSKLLQSMRYFNVYGKNEDHKKDQASPYYKFKKQFEETGKIKLFENSENYFRDFISIEELIDKKYIVGKINFLEYMMLVLANQNLFIM